jgi:hypothetical protein
MEPFQLVQVLKARVPPLLPAAKQLRREENPDGSRSLQKL